MSQDSGENDWIFDSIITYFKSPVYKNTIMSFIDEHCIVFDSEEENKLEYTDIHNKFKKLFEGLIDQLLSQIGLDAASFANACEKVSVKLYKDIVG